MNQPKILDLDKLVADKRIVRLKGKEIDVSSVPSSVTLDITANYDLLKSEDPSSFDLILNSAVKICQVSDKTITKEWLIQNTNIDQLQALIEFVMQPMHQRVETHKKKYQNRPKKKQPHHRQT